MIVPGSFTDWTVAALAALAVVSLAFADARWVLAEPAMAETETPELEEDPAERRAA